MSNRSLRGPTHLQASLAVVTLVLAACGGGGGDTAAPSTAVSGAAGPAAISAGSTCGLADFTASALARINPLRATGADCGSAGRFGAVAALAWNAKLVQAADGHSKDMAANNFFFHTSADGRTLADRVNAAGYVWAGLGENIAAGHPSVNAVMDGWIASPGHCANLMNASFTEVGLVCVPGTATSNYTTYWTMDLARAR